MAETIRVGSLRGIMMRGPGITSTLPFYEDMWGLSLAHKEDGIALLRGTGEEPFLYGLKDGPVYGIEYVHFAMPDRASMDALYRQVIARGGIALAEPDLFDDYAGGYGFEMLDPDNRRLRFRTEALTHDEEPEWAKPRKVSHVVLNTPDMDGVQEFYTHVLGFRVSDYSADQMVFLRCNSDHHSIALVRGNYASVNHVAFEMPSIDEFMRGIGRMKQKGHVPTWGPGRHGPGNNPFAYFVSPSGFVIEFTSELQQIDETTHEAQVWPRDKPEAMDRWMTAGPPTPAQRAVMQGRPDPGFPELAPARSKI
ncbi:VOC family protein [Nitratireductor sp. L1-7-SE]|uniref:VOC family protein n=1 Tax=Nitratireductor rhodophyticola TaxID=2854036 RepID=A0ABS7R9G7_9HYPH|nr:VOC family protein [Nitratireductor rhodophyticola]MBY8917582.1 VOC family protein [Nitratireductor rhodophyticola]MBY8922293.1 VOC family protein [Nitratireductor rhodophyticola]